MFLPTNDLLSNKLLLNKSKSFSMLFKMKQNSLENSLNIIFLDKTPIKHTSQVKYLGLGKNTKLGGFRED